MPGMFGGRPGMPPGMPPGIFLAILAICFRRRHAADPPMPSIWPSPAIGPRLPLPMAFIMSAMVRCIFNSLLISSGLVPEPAAMRFLRLA